MNAAVICFVALVAFALAYRFYGSFLAGKIFRLGEMEGQPTPAREFEDGVDFVPTNKQVLIGHHFSSIAGAAPIVGPAVAAIWGWLPALIWVVCGVIFMGAAHDFGALVLSMHNRGGSMAQVSESLLGPRVRTLFIVVIFFLVWMVIAVFTLVIANLFITFPSAVIPVNFEIIIALLMGLLINKQNKNLLIPSLMAQGGLMVMIYVGTQYPISLKAIAGGNEMMVWMIFLLIYSFIASTLPVWALLQPRDFINSHQLFLGLSLMVCGLFVVHPTVVAPAFNPDPEGAPPWFPFLFITIACGAISGFHGLVSGGTSSKQVARWSDSQNVGYGSMLGEGLLALLAALAVTTGFSSTEAWHNHYSSWNAANGLSAKINAFVLGAGNFVSGLGISQEISQTVIAVLIISFAATSLDTATRIQRYIIAEFGKAYKIKAMENRYLSSGFAVGSAFLLMMTSQGGKGGLHLWPLFGATNQMLAGLTLVLISVFLYKRRANIRPFLLPAIFIITMTSIGLVLNIKNFVTSSNWLLAVIGVILFVTQVLIVVESIRITLKAAREEL